MTKDLFIDDKKYAYEKLEDKLPYGLDAVYLGNFQRIRDAYVRQCNETTSLLLRLLVYAGAIARSGCLATQSRIWTY